MRQKTSIKNFMELAYDQLEAMNLEAIKRVKDRTPASELKKYYISYLKNEPALKAVTVCFSDLEGRFHRLDYDKKFLLKAHDNLTFDGSSIKGFSHVMESDLRLEIDWGSFRWLPSDIFGPGKVMVFSFIKDREGKTYESDLRGRLRDFTLSLYKKEGITANFAVECEGFLLKGPNAEQRFDPRKGLKMISSGGYFNALPNDPLRLFIDQFAEGLRCMGFINEKDHPEVAPSQFELNYTYTDPLMAADLLQVYKLVARQVAANSGNTACFLPKPIVGINGSGMHCNISLSKGGRNLFWDKKGEENISKRAWNFVDRLLNNANEICLIMNPSVNAYRRLDPAFEAPNQIKSSAVDRTSMVRIPLGNKSSARIEVRTVSPDTNPYLLFYTLLKTGLEGPLPPAISSEGRRSRTRFLPGNINDAIKHFKGSKHVTKLLGKNVKEKYTNLKTATADRSPKELGNHIKLSEVIFHHEVTNQYLWSRF
ncbi:MAG: glutamine synthetase [Acidobacteria bacterium]|nr:MAG: glutamine synthetase [Acidobacteriota bacterium]